MKLNYILFATVLSIALVTQYDPKQEQAFQNEDIIQLTSISNLELLDNDDLSIEIECDKTEFIQGEPINVILKLKNNTGKTFKIYRPKNYLHNLDKDSTFIGEFGSTPTLIKLPPYSNYYYYDNPEDFVLAGTDFSTHSLRPGNYKYYVSISDGNNKYVSNKIGIKIIPVPDSLQKAFNELKFVPGKYKKLEGYESLAEKYKGTTYEEIFLRKLLSFYHFSFDTSKNYRDKVSKMFNEFILKYPNSANSYYLFQEYFSDFEGNKVYMEDILQKLIINKPDCKLLEVLRHQDYYYDKIKFLLK